MQTEQEPSGTSGPTVGDLNTVEDYVITAER
jgi:hypothetical protein